VLVWPSSLVFIWRNHQRQLNPLVALRTHRGISISSLCSVVIFGTRLSSTCSGTYSRSIRRLQIATLLAAIPLGRSINPVANIPIAIRLPHSPWGINKAVMQLKSSDRATLEASSHDSFLRPPLRKAWRRENGGQLCVYVDFSPCH